MILKKKLPLAGWVLYDLANQFFALLFFAIANFGCQAAIIFYNSLMVKVAPPERIGFVSGLGRMFGYTGANKAV